MAEESQAAAGVTEADFEERVIRASSERAVVVDFWAAWCQPCRVLGPTLEKAVSSFGAAAALVKVNVDEQRGLAARYGIRGIPTVIFFRNGEPAAEMVGVRGEPEIRQVLSRLVPSEADGLAAGAAELAASGRADEAEAAFRLALEKQPDHPASLVGLALVALEKGEHGAAREALVRVPPGSPGGDQAEGLLARIEFLESCAQAGGREAADKALADGPGDPDAMYASAVCLAAGERYAEALELLFRIVECEKSYRDGAAKDAMVRIFAAVGKRSELADAYRAKLARALY